VVKALVPMPSPGRVLDWHALQHRWQGCWQCQAACRQVLPAEGGALSHGRILALDEIPSDSPVLVVPVPQADETPPPEEVPKMEEGAEDLVGGSVQGDGKGQGAVESP